MTRNVFTQVNKELTKFLREVRLMNLLLSPFVLQK